MSTRAGPGRREASGAPVWPAPAQKHAAGVLRASVERGDVTHAWAFVGPAGVGQRRAARALAAGLNCPAPDAPCGACDVCDRCLRGVYPAYWEFAPTGAAHRVAEVRERWLPAAFRSAPEGRWKVLRVLEADRMNEAAANAFLKGLEEPPPATSWVLEVADPDELPDTVLSRCRVVRFAAWSPAALDAEARRLGLHDAGERALAVRACLGSPATLRRLAGGGLDDLRRHRSIPRRLRDQGPGYALVAVRALDDEVRRHAAETKAAGRREREELTRLYGDEVPRGIARQVEERAARRERETRTRVLQAALDDLVAWYRDCLLVASGGDPAGALNLDAGDELRADAGALGPSGALGAADLVLATREGLELNVQHTLALEALFLELSSLTRST
ncbi:MAG: hypothetical protein KY434_04755 [Actinobacteria bacterium]|nr:hypothetical protein [Actinomycetota bacterium]